MDHKSILSFFSDVETMVLPEAPGLGKGFGKALELPGRFAHREPWTGGSNITAKQATFYVVHLGVAPKRVFVQSILKALSGGVEPDEAQVSEVSGYASVGALALDWEGRVLADSIQIAPFLYCVRRLRKKENLEGLDEEIEESVTKGVSSHFSTPVPLLDPFKPASSFSEEGSERDPLDTGVKVYETPATMSALMSISRSLLTVAGIPHDNMHLRVVPHVVRRQKDKTLSIPSFEEGMLASFYKKDLSRISKHLDKVSKTALNSFLSDSVDEKDRVDVLTDTNALAEMISPEKLTQARWPANPAHSLNIAQQASVGVVKEMSQGLASVNGPPGTGKTTLLRDIISDFVVERALRLTDLKNPSFGMEKTTVRPLLKDQEPFEASFVMGHLVQGTGIFVASNNNAAVENVSLELPRVSSIDTQAFPNASYVAKAAQDLAAVMDKKGDRPADVWGLMALRMGNKDNIHSVLSGLNRPFGETENKRGLVDALYAMPPIDQSEWDALCADFQAKRARVRDLIDARAGLWSKIQALPFMQEMEGFICPLADGVRAAFPWIDVLYRSPKSVSLSFFRQARDGGENASWSLQDGKRLRGAALACSLRRACILARLDIGLARLGWNVPDVAFFKAAPEVYHTSSVWTDPEFEKARTQVFLAAMKVQEGFLRWNKKELYGLMRALRKVLLGSVFVSDDVLVSVWNSLFILSPVVSTTLASMRRLPLRPGWIGLMLIDEAGQATPQSVVGALYRSRRAVVVGDPLQIEPVFSVPSPIVEHLLSMHKVEPRYSPLTASAQSVADSVMKHGAWVPRNPGADVSEDLDSTSSFGSENASVWTGMPLRVHRRCQDPMFLVSNEISYGHQMVQGAPSIDVSNYVENALGESAWIDVVGGPHAGKVRAHEMACLEACLRRFDRAWPQARGRPLETFVISPFVDVAAACREVTQNVFGRGAYRRCPTGTVHTFQGREADIVFLVLGSAPGQDGAHSRAWAAQRANLLNVALTRARLCVYVLGASQDWKSLPYFSILHEKMTLNERIRVFPKE